MNNFNELPDWITWNKEKGKYILKSTITEKERKRLLKKYKEDLKALT